MLDMEQYKKAVKENIEKFINNNELEEAENIIKEYEELVPNDVDVYSFKGVIAIMYGNMEEAEKVLKDGLLVGGDNFDLNYNLAYLFEFQEKQMEAYKYYNKALKYCDLEIRNQILEKINNLEKNEEIIKYKNIKDNILKPPAITIITKVYNSKEYIRECAESVLNQSFKDFEWVVLDNGCTDGTSEILKEYAEEDKRIKLFKNEVNSIIYNKPNNPDFNNYMFNTKSEYMCDIDSDDFFHTDFLNNLYSAAKKHNSDIAVSGTEMFQEEDTNRRGQRIPPDFYTSEIDRVGDIFPQIYGSFRPLWGKLIRSPIYIKARRTVLDYTPKILNGSDTLICLEVLKNSNSMVSLNKVLHYYRIRKNSHYHSQVNKNRYLDYLKIYEESKRLLETWHKLNKTNQQFIGAVLYYSMQDCINIDTNAINVPLEDKIEVINTILSDVKVRTIVNEVGLFANLLDDATKSIDIIIEIERKNRKR